MMSAINQLGIYKVHVLYNYVWTGMEVDNSESSELETDLVK